MTKLYLIRHGQSEANLSRLFAGHSDFLLTETGRMQAERVAEWFTDKPVDFIAASDLLRAYHTAVPLAQGRGMTVTPMQALREVYAGRWEGMAFTAIEETYAADYAVWKNDIGRAVCTEGESVRHLGQRVLAAVTELAQAHDGRSAVIATHATPIRTLLSLWQTGDVLAMKDIPWVPNASITEVRYENGVFTPEKIGMTDHLDGLVTKLPTNV